MKSKSYISALDQYQALVWEYQSAKKAYDDDPIDYNLERLRESILKLRQQERVIEFNRWLFSHGGDK